MKKELILILLLLTLLNLQAQEKTSYIISGKVVDDFEQAISNCTIAAWQVSDSSLVSGAVTDDNGSFKIEHLQAGTYELRFSHILYEKKSLRWM